MIYESMICDIDRRSTSLVVSRLLARWCKHDCEVICQENLIKENLSKTQNFFPENSRNVWGFWMN